MGEHTPNDRPTSVTILSCFFVFCAIVEVFRICTGAVSELEDFALAVLATTLFVFWGVGIFRGLNLARIVYLIFAPIFGVINLLLGGISIRLIFSFLELHEACIRINTSGTSPPKKLLEKLTGPYGPLSNFAGRIQIAYAYGLISEADFKDLELIREIRNEAAHAPFDFSFQDAGVSGAVMCLTWEERCPQEPFEYPADPDTSDFIKLSDERQHFVLAAMTLETMLLKSVITRERERRRKALQNDNSAGARLRRACSDNP